MEFYASNAFLRSAVFSKTRARVIAAVGERIPLKAASIDVAISINALDHCADPRQVIHEISRVLRPRGVLLLVTETRPLFRAGHRDPMHPNRPTAFWILRSLRGAGIKPVEVRYVILRMSGTYRKLRLAAYPLITEVLIVGSKMV